ncbi:SgcJ/EcaC family oxidoreductase [Actinomadura nitritigenes]|uniref:SgcJ/EcaC family oxidoreductase n=2 Tax=Actinomadura nitritigenes TaxID=134602 RepID=A0ABS3RDI6_9ACTN|nr:SgcJ/EcaC family oxidoreductase [Actinomadura nitritigenes]
MSSARAAGMYRRAHRNTPGEPITRENPMPNTRVQDEAAIQAVLADSYKAWEAGDADGMVADYTTDATAIMPGSLRDGREVIRQSMAQGFAGPLKGSSTSNKQLSIRFLGQDAAIVISESAILFPGETEITDDRRKVNATWVFEKRDARWLIAAYHNSPVLTPEQ